MRYTNRNSQLASHTKSKFFAAFFTTICIISAFAVFSFITSLTARYSQGSYDGVARGRAFAERDVVRLLKKDRECRLVHDEEDKCAFIQAYCPDEEAGLLSYLTLYYCDLPHAQPFAFLLMALWLALLFSTIGIAASDFFCVNLSTIATILGMSESMAGVTFLALGNGSPDVFSTFAAMRTHSGSLAVGELIGAAGFITAVVAGSMALVREFRVGKKAFVRDVGFFIVAASFSMAFLADGKLYLWECCTMIGFYLFYVVTVVTWHWYLHRRRKQRDKSNLARSHYITPSSHEIEVQAAHEDGDEDEDAPTNERRSLIQNRSSEDFGALERAGSPEPNQGSYYDDESEDDGEGSKFLAAEMRNSMRVTRHRGSRRNTLNPIRPSLVGALEFRSVLSTLQKSRTLQSASINLRRYSDDPIVTSDRYLRPGSDAVMSSDYGGSVVITGAEDSDDTFQPESSALRARAVSMNDASGSKDLNPIPFAVVHIPEIGVVAATPPLKLHSQDRSASGSTGLIDGPRPSHFAAGIPSPAISVSPPLSVDGSRSENQKDQQSHQKHDDKLMGAGDGFPGTSDSVVDFFQPHHASHLLHVSNDSSGYRSINRPQLIIPTSHDSSRERSLSPNLAFPRYTDSPLPMTALSPKAPSLILPEPQVPLDQTVVQGLDNFQLKRVRWWPYCILPCPRLLFSTLFPTLTMWSNKSIWDKVLSVISAPSIFLLTVTLPVVEPESKDDEPIEETEDVQQSLSRRTTTPRVTASSPYLGANIQPEWLEYRRSTLRHHRTRSSVQTNHGLNHTRSAADLVERIESIYQNPQSALVNGQNEEDVATAGDGSLRTEWNRWLVVIQIFTSPMFVVLIVWANSSGDELTLRHFMKMALYSLLASLVVFLILLLTTSADKTPKYRYLLCFLGFVVSVSWISTIAGEVVGVLKAFGVILGISDAILGLTIFAVGNSLGDLVADITVARLGFPVMALSACFGGPMLNILLGIGISGLYMTVTDGNRKHVKHPEKPLKYPPYHIHVGSTLIISGIVLLVTLVGLLIVVPLNKWVMDRRIGWGLIVLWSIGTLVNLIVEVISSLGQSVSAS